MVTQLTFFFLQEVTLLSFIYSEPLNYEYFAYDITQPKGGRMMTFRLKA